MLKEYLSDRVKDWGVIGHPALLERFVLRNGCEYSPTPRIGRRGKQNQCFGNAAEAVQAMPHWKYVEGFAIRRTDPVTAFHHAWVTTNGINAMDTTLPNANDYEYFGVEFDTSLLMREIRSNDVYGLLDFDFSLNSRLMFELDPELKAIVEAVKPHKVWEKMLKEQDT